jgi:hypothetical protein
MVSDTGLAGWRVVTDQAGGIIVGVPANGGGFFRCRRGREPGHEVSDTGLTGWRLTTDQAGVKVGW